MVTETRLYLDHNATTPLRPQAWEALMHALAIPGNASSVHSEGRAARALVEESREKVAALAGARAKNVVFTGSGTEANNAVLTPQWQGKSAPRPRALLVGATEHPCILQGYRFSKDAVERIPVDEKGIVDLGWLEQRLASLAPDVALVSLQLANNETGVIQPMAEVAALVRSHGGILHTDAVQAAGKISIDLKMLGAHALTLSAHKFGGPKGSGALILASDEFEPMQLLRGGGQERGRRAGTENVAAIAGMGAAAEAALAQLEDEKARLLVLREEAERLLCELAPQAVIFSKDAKRLPNTFSFALPGLRAETALIAFDLAGVALSSGSACSSGKVKLSHVLEAMGVGSALNEGALRVSFGWSSTSDDVYRFAGTCEEVITTLYKRRENAA